MVGPSRPLAGAAPVVGLQHRGRLPGLSGPPATLATYDPGAAMNESQDLIASRKRTAHPEFVSTFSLSALQARLPLRFWVPVRGYLSPKRRYRSRYHYLGYADLACPDQLADLTLFEIALRLIDFSPLRDYLAQAYYVPSSKGQVPFDPVSLFLCVCLRRELGCGWRGVAKLLAGEHGPGWRRLFGFCAGDTPSASGLR